MIGETPPHVGALVLDTAVGRLAEWRARSVGSGGCGAYLGAYEWDARAEDLRRTETVHLSRGADTPRHTHGEQLTLYNKELSEAVDCRVCL